MRLQKKIENLIESALWSARFLTAIPVVFGIISVFTLFWLGSIEIIHGFNAMIHPAHAGEMIQEVATKAKDPVKLVLSGIIGGIDLYLIGIVLLIFSFGVYELFISKIDVGRREDQDVKILEIKSLDELKDKILKVIVMVLIVSFFKEVINKEVTSYQDLLYLAISILLVAASGYLMHIGSHHPTTEKHEYAGHSMEHSEHSKSIPEHE
jgi:uncharacterized membrane protein YqhA